METQDDLTTTHHRRPRTAAQIAGGGLKAGRTQITNGTKLLPDVDGRNLWVRRCRDLINLHTDDLGGESNVSVAEAALIRRACVMITELERLEVKFAQDLGTPEDLDLYQPTAGNLRRLLEAVGLRRRPRDVTPDPLDYARTSEEVAP